MPCLSKGLRFGTLAVVASAGTQPNPPEWPSSVQIFSPDDDINVVQARLDDSWAKNGGQGTDWPEPRARYSPFRFSFLFKPGEYNVNAPIGYYVHIAGIGASPDDVVFRGGTGPHVPCENRLPQPGQLVTFWRTVERFKRVGNMDWFVSQAAPIRDIHVDGNLNLHKETSNGSGGYIANCKVTGDVKGGGQQQWFTRNVEVGGTWEGIAWNTVFVGCTSNTNQESMSSNRCGEAGMTSQTVVIETTPLIAEKPFISVDPVNATKFNLNVPPVETNAVGTRWHTMENMERVIPFEDVYVTDLNDTVQDMNARLDEGLHLVVSAGIYLFDAPLEIKRDDTVVLCLGLSSFVSTNGNALIQVAPGLGGVRVGGCLLEASYKPTEALFQWGNESQSKDTPNTSFAYDLITRVGGPAFNGRRGGEAQAKIHLKIDSNDVVADHLWLWRGDHYNNNTENAYGDQDDDIVVTHPGELPNEHGLVVTADRIKVYNLAVEHPTEDQVIWSGEDGEVYFFQCEIPYEMDPAWAAKNFVSYRVNDSVQRHQAYGVGAYTYFPFKDNNGVPSLTDGVPYDTMVETGFGVPDHLVSSMHQPFVVKLWGFGGIKTTINGKGPGRGGTGREIGYDNGPAYFNNICNFSEREEPPAEPSSTPAPENEPLNPLPIILGAIGIAVVCGVVYYLFTREDGNQAQQEEEMAQRLEAT